MQQVGPDSSNTPLLDSQQPILARAYTPLLFLMFNAVDDLQAAEWRTCLCPSHRSQIQQLHNEIQSTLFELLHAIEETGNTPC